MTGVCPSGGLSHFVGVVNTLGDHKSPYLALLWDPSYSPQLGVDPMIRYLYVDNSSREVQKINPAFQKKTTESNNLLPSLWHRNPTTFPYRGYKSYIPYFYSLKCSFFCMVFLGSKGRCVTFWHSNWLRFFRWGSKTNAPRKNRNFQHTGLPC